MKKIPCKWIPKETTKIQFVDNMKNAALCMAMKKKRLVSAKVTNSL
jgi:hypothetical protein